MAGFGVIGGSGLYQMAALEDRREENVRTPFGEPSDRFVLGRLGGRDIAFLARHGRGHRLLPSEINFRANMYGFKALGVERIVSVSAVGSMKEHLHPLDIVLPDQLIDGTRHRAGTFFGDGVVAHVSLADPFCGDLSGTVAEATEAIGARLHRGGIYLCIEGPQFSTRAESNLYRSWKVDVIGMTNAQEVKLAREAEICYATMAMVTDYDCWKEGEDAVSVEEVVARLNDNARTAATIVEKVASSLPKTRSCQCGGALQNAILTDRSRIPPEVRERLNLILGRHLD
ncbi:MAG: S-methyl-5'-thioadenosine phosphorylase [Acidobacteria bacterium]|nr:S-methyl-5'-thioadenosine phosphorylase [Acidobacteriota bacterium]